MEFIFIFGCALTDMVQQQFVQKKKKKLNLSKVCGMDFIQSILNTSTSTLCYQTQKVVLTQRIGLFCWCSVSFIFILYGIISYDLLSYENIDEFGQDINIKYELRPQIDLGPQDPRKDGILLGLGLAKTGTTSLYATFCSHSLLNSNCRIDKPEDKYWHKCVWQNFQPRNTTNLFLYDIDDILQNIDNVTYEKECSFDAWTYYSYVYTNPAQSFFEKRRRRSNFIGFKYNNDTKEYSFNNNIFINDNSSGNDTHQGKKSKMLVRGYHGKTTNHFGSIYISHILHHLMIKHNLNLKLYVIFRNPMSRILSSLVLILNFMINLYFPQTLDHKTCKIQVIYLW